MLAKSVIRQLDKAGFELRLFSREVNQSMFDKEYKMAQDDVLNPNDLDRANPKQHLNKGLIQKRTFHLYP